MFLNLIQSLDRLGLILCRRRFDARQTLSDIEAFDADVLVAVPAMLQRIANVPEFPAMRVAKSYACNLIHLPGPGRRR
jgi:hypothetical protein